MPTTDQEDIESYKESTASAGSKLSRKYKAAAALTTKRLHSSETWDKWHSRVSSQEAKEKAKRRAGKVTEQNLIDGMDQKGVDNYQNSTQSEAVINKWATRSKPFRDAAKSFKETKKLATNNAERLANVKAMMEKMQDLASKQ